MAGRHRKAPTRWEELINNAAWMVTFFVVGLVAIVAFKSFIIGFYTVPTSSMEPTIKPGDRVFAKMYDRTSIDRGDVIVFSGNGVWDLGDYDGSSNILAGQNAFIKRVVAIPGDTVGGCSPDGKLMVNGSGVDEPYIQGSSGCDFPEVTVPDDAYWVLGDNRDNSMDSRWHSTVRDGNFRPDDGFVYHHQILGTAIMR